MLVVAAVSSTNTSFTRDRGRVDRRTIAAAARGRPGGPARSRARIFFERDVVAVEKSPDHRRRHLLDLALAPDGRSISCERKVGLAPMKRQAENPRAPRRAVNAYRRPSAAAHSCRARATAATQRIALEKLTPNRRADPRRARRPSSQTAETTRLRKILRKRPHPAPPPIRRTSRIQIFSALGTPTDFNSAGNPL